MYWIYRFNQLLRQGWHYLNPPVFDSENPTIWKPIKFSANANIEILKKCWELESNPKNYPNHQRSNHRTQNH